MGFHVNVPDLPPVDDSEPQVEEFYSSWSLFLVCALLILSLLTSYFLKIKKIKTVHETLVSIVAGMVVGLVVRIAPGTMIEHALTFKHLVFFNILLPPIILNSGYELKQANFFRNFGSILVFAFIGTTISAVGVGLLVYTYSILGFENVHLSLLECLVFGSTLSATDPVTVLAIFNQYKVDPKLYTVIFGESLLNDAVSIVMYDTLTQFHGSEIYFSSLFHGIGIFLLNFSVSMALGVSFGLALSLLLKHSYLHHYSSIESCLVALFAYTSYFLANGLKMSGIVSLLFCGITLKHYAYHTMSRRTQQATKYTFSTLAHLTENFIFIYLGLALFTSSPDSEPVFSYVKPLFILITTIAVVFARYIAVFPLSTVINFFQKHARGQRSEELPHSYQMMLFWAGLRGAVGVALATGFKGPNAQIMRTTVLVVVVLTVVVFGGTTSRMLEILGIRTGVEDEEATSSDEDEGGPFMLNGGPSSSSGYLARSARGRGQWSRYWDELEGSALSPPAGSFYNHTAAAAQIGTHYAARYNHQFQPNNDSTWASNTPMFSAASSDSYDSDGGEVLPLAPTAVQHLRQGSDNDNNVANSDNNTHPPRSGLVAEDRRWFQNLDERYLLPLFSNATASRTFHARKTAKRRAAPVGDVGNVGSRSGSGPNSPIGAGGGVGGAGGSVGVVGLGLESTRRAGIRSGLATPAADSDDEYLENRIPATGLSQVITNPIGVSGGSGGGSSGSSGNGSGGESARRAALVDDSRTERGLASPTLRGNASSPWDEQ
ncbi:hypothetical protein Agabi119p4_11349 [Agaricus bisporus var. burnettii]|uniref:Sodium/hydrogen exchanger n=1 Tax=Agaricus bisporus var. burnettii TaxID=192524 RepID=A0A8H7EU46_AGABI|nr:hypothetical protein Agabi119p4_11349 [Agaricus bisporus var. burnettii]